MSISTPIASLGVLHTLPASLTGGRIAAVEHTLPPGLLGAPVHRHSREDELTIVLAGELGACLGGEIVTAQAGGYVWKPRDQWHTFWNAGTVPLRFIELLLPGGFAGYFEQLSRLFQASDTCPAPTAMAAIARAFGLDVDLDETARICARFGVNLG
jgi:quercetin dioxygenase-like cupin family protein